MILSEFQSIAYVWKPAEKSGPLYDSDAFDGTSLSCRQHRVFDQALPVHPPRGANLHWRVEARTPAISQPHSASWRGSRCTHTCTRTCRARKSSQRYIRIPPCFCAQLAKGDDRFENQGRHRRNTPVRQYPHSFFPMGNECSTCPDRVLSR